MPIYGLGYYEERIGEFLGLGMLPTGTFLLPVSATSVIEVRDLPHEVGLSMRNIFMYIMSIWVVPGARDAADGHVFVAGVGVVGRRGPGPSPSSRA